MFKRTLFILLSLILVLTLSIGNIALAAQDYNSSRSNNPRPITEGKGDESEDEEDDFKLILKIGEKRVLKVIEESYLTVAPFMGKNRTMVPIRFISERLGFEVEWNGDTEEIVIAPAQDYNISRSNKPRPLVPKDSIDDKGESGEEIDKEDHNIKELKR